MSEKISLDSSENYYKKWGTPLLLYTLSNKMITFVSKTSDLKAYQSRT